MIDLGEDKKASHVRGTTPSFAEIVGQTELKRALLTVAANSELNGLLIQGEKGTAKSTAVRALTALLPTQTVVEDCPYGCPPNDSTRQCDDCRGRTAPPTTERPVPLVTLPLGATRERVAGTLSVADALAGDYEFDPGLLARANRGFLYVDEVNLLDDHLVDVLLDAAASGVNTVERDGVSVSHPAQFTLVGTMNPEEGDLRPQLRDRFALQATVTACEDIDQRVSIIDQAIGRDDRRVSGHMGRNGPDTDAYRDQLGAARDLLTDVELSTALAREIAELCRDSGADGHRGDIATARTAMTFAALDGRTTVTEPDVREAAALALPHRLRSQPFEDAPDPDELIDDHFDGEQGDDENAEETEETDRESDSARGPSEETPEPGDEDEGGEPDPSTDGSGGGDHEADESSTDPEPSHPGKRESESGVEAQANGDDREPEDADEGEGTPVIPGQSRAAVGAGRAPEIAAPDVIDGGSGGGSRTRTRPHVDDEGARVRSRRAETTTRIDAAASVRAARSRGASSIESRDLRQSVRQGDASSLVLFVVDASASMLPAMRTAKGTVLELLKDAYEKRDEVAFVTFAGEGADVLLPPTNSITLAARHLKELPTGDRTPLPAGLRTACEVLDRSDPAASVVVLVTDGRANVADESPVRETREAARQLTEYDPHVVVVDAGDGDRTQLTGVIAEETGGNQVPLSALSVGRIESAVGAVRES